MVLGLLLAAAVQADAPVATAAPAPQIAFSRKTEAVGPVLQVVFGERAVVRLDERGHPALVRSEKGKLAEAHPAGAVEEAFAAPEGGELAVALDGSAETKKTVLKVWNGGEQAVRYDVVVLVLRGGALAPRPVGGCVVAGKGVRIQSWPAPVVAVALTKFSAAPSGEAACK